jgi:hypothetical protein
MSPVDVVAAAIVMSLVLLADPTVKLPTDTVEEDVGKLSAPSKLVEFGVKLTAPAVLSDMCVESTRFAVVIAKSPPTWPETGSNVNIRPESRPKLKESSPELIVVRPFLVSIVSDASHNPNEPALDVEPEIDKPALSPLARKVMLSVDVLLGPSKAA